MAYWANIFGMAGAACIAITFIDGQLLPLMWGVILFMGRLQALEEQVMYSTTFLIVTTVVLGGACLHALWYARQHEKG